jgi:hypothetical protein
MIIAHADDTCVSSSISLGLSVLRTCPNEAARTLCKTFEGPCITYRVFAELLSKRCCASASHRVGGVRGPELPNNKAREALDAHARCERQPSRAISSRSSTIVETGGLHFELSHRAAS